MVRLNERPKDASLYCLTAKFLKKLQTFEKNIESVRSSAHFHATNLGVNFKLKNIYNSNKIQGLSDYIKNFAEQSRPLPVLFARSEQNRPRPQRVAPNPIPEVQQPPDLPQQQQQLQLQQPPQQIQPQRIQPHQIQAQQIQPHQIQPQQIQPEQQQQQPQNPAQMRLLDGENIQIGEGANVNIIIHVADEHEREGRVREIMNRFGAGAEAGDVGGEPDIIAFGNNEGVAGLHIINGRQHEQVLNGLLRGVFDFLDQVAVEPGVRNEERNNHGQDPILEIDPVVDEIAIFDRDLLDNGQMAAQNVQRRRVQIRLRLEHPEAAVNNQPIAEIEHNEPDAEIMVQEEEDVHIPAHVPIPARRRGRPPNRRGNRRVVAPEPEEPVVVEENDDVRGGLALRRLRRRNPPRHDPVQRVPRGNNRNRRQGMAFEVCFKLNYNYFQLADKPVDETNNEH